MSTSKFPLHDAARNNDFQQVKSLLKSGKVDPNGLNQNGNAPLHISSGRGYLEIADLLLEDEKINPNLEDENGYTALTKAVNRDNPATIKALIEAGAFNDMNNPHVQKAFLELISGNPAHPTNIRRSCSKCNDKSSKGWRSCCDKNNKKFGR